MIIGKLSWYKRNKTLLDTLLLENKQRLDDESNFSLGHQTTPSLINFLVHHT